MSKGTATAVATESTVDWSAIIGAIDETGGSLGRIAEGALSNSIVAMDEGGTRVRPLILSARVAWKAEKRDRNVNDYTADMALATATATDPKAWARFGKVDGKRTALNLAAVRFVNFALHHSAENEAKYKSIYESYDIESYCDFLPTAWQYTNAGNLIKSVKEAADQAAALAEVTASVSGDTRMFSIDVNAIDVVKNASSVSDKLVELRSLLHDAQEQYSALYETATKADKSTANTAYKSRKNSKMQAKIKAGMLVKGYAI